MSYQEVRDIVQRAKPPGATRHYKITLISDAWSGVILNGTILLSEIRIAIIYEGL